MPFVVNLPNLSVFVAFLSMGFLCFGHKSFSLEYNKKRLLQFVFQSLCFGALLFLYLKTIIEFEPFLLTMVFSVYFLWCFLPCIRDVNILMLPMILISCIIFIVKIWILDVDNSFLDELGVLMLIIASLLSKKSVKTNYSYWIFVLYVLGILFFFFVKTVFEINVFYAIEFKKYFFLIEKLASYTMLMIIGLPYLSAPLKNFYNLFHPVSRVLIISIFPILVISENLMLKDHIMMIKFREVAQASSLIIIFAYLIFMMFSSCISRTLFHFYVIYGGFVVCVLCFSEDIQNVKLAIFSYSISSICSYLSILPFKNKNGKFFDIQFPNTSMLKDDSFSALNVCSFLMSTVLVPVLALSISSIILSRSDMLSSIVFREISTSRLLGMISARVFLVANIVFFTKVALNFFCISKFSKDCRSERFKIENGEYDVHEPKNFSIASIFSSLSILCYLFYSLSFENLLYFVNIIFPLYICVIIFSIFFIKCEIKDFKYAEIFAYSEILQLFIKAFSVIFELIEIIENRIKVLFKDCINYISPYLNTLLFLYNGKYMNGKDFGIAVFSMVIVFILILIFK